MVPDDGHSAAGWRPRPRRASASDRRVVLLEELRPSDSPDTLSPDDRALHAELEIGLLLPCNVIVYESGPRESVVAAMAPLAALGIVGDNPTLMSVATEADQWLRKALADLEAEQNA
jgi:hypothetical protein